MEPLAEAIRVKPAIQGLLIETCCQSDDFEGVPGCSTPASRRKCSQRKRTLHYFNRRANHFSRTDNTGQAVGMSSEVCQYRMTSLPRGHCLIINNVHFIQMAERRGSDKDAEVLKDVFQWLGFTVTVLLDQTAVQAREELKRFGDETHGDAFVGCVLSHGGKGVIYGTDDEPISTNDLFSPFKGTNCSTLIGKPKAFFIQACRGKDTQARVQLETDTNPGHQIYIPADADFLFAMATVEDYCSFRVIQTLCKQLKQGCPR
uniref:LOW QUALITY PROTEIN: caspase-10-like n=1 Tax=Oncorhynchus gorbuscha TaxID=8017 RepID=UPI001EAE8BAE|nr:LOW QUALITY PROTEIN: caspase-10-like [Oncorhynchus gorbuscha]